MSKWEKVEDNIFRFEKVGDEIEGLLISKETNEVYGNGVYKLRKGKDNFVVFGTVVLDRKMKDIKVNTEVKIVFVEELEPSKRGHNPVKMFDVFTRG